MKRRAIPYLLLVPIMIGALACGGGAEEAGAPAADAGGEEAGAAEMVDPSMIADAGSISGTVEFTGSAPDMEIIQMSADPFCLQQHEGEEVRSRRVVVNENDTLRWVFVHVKEGLEGKRFPTPEEPVTMDQQGCRYHPHVLGVQAGQTITIVNSDDTLHNINAQPQNNPAFNIGQPMAGMETERSFPNPEVMIPVKCDVHPWMNSYIGVTAHPYHAVSGAEGGFSLENLPPGDYVVEAWHEQFGSQTQNVTVEPNQAAEITFTFGS